MYADIADLMPVFAFEKAFSFNQIFFSRPGRLEGGKNYIFISKNNSPSTIHGEGARG